MTADDALENATRLLNHAELEVDLVKMERVAGLADSWIAIAQLLTERDRV